MRPSPDLADVFLCLEPVDFRKGINGLALLVESDLALNPFAASLFVFRNRRRDKVKILYWENNGFCLWQKRLEKERFHWLERSNAETATITGQQLNWLLDGFDIARMRPHKSLKYACVS